MQAHLLQSPQAEERFLPPLKGTGDSPPARRAPREGRSRPRRLRADINQAARGLSWPRTSSRCPVDCPAAMAAAAFPVGRSVSTWYFASSSILPLLGVKSKAIRPFLPPRISPAIRGIEPHWPITQMDIPGVSRSDNEGLKAHFNEGEHFYYRKSDLQTDKKCQGESWLTASMATLDSS